MSVVVLCLKVEQKQVCKQLLHVGKIQYYYVNKKNSKVDYSYSGN